MKPMLGRLASSIVLVALTLILLATSLRYAPDSRTVPFAVSIVTLILLGIDMASQGEGRIPQLLRRGIGGVGSVRPGEGSDPGDTKKEIAGYLWIVGFTALAVLAGFYVAIPVYVVAYLRLYARRPLAISLLIALVLTTALYVLFAILLGYDIFEGLVFGGYM